MWPETWIGKSLCVLWSTDPCQGSCPCHRDGPILAMSSQLSLFAAMRHVLKTTLPNKSIRDSFFYLLPSSFHRETCSREISYFSLLFNTAASCFLLNHHVFIIRICLSKLLVWFFIGDFMICWPRIVRLGICHFFLCLLLFLQLKLEWWTRF